MNKRLTVDDVMFHLIDNVEYIVDSNVAADAELITEQWIDANITGITQAWLEAVDDVGELKHRLIEAGRRNRAALRLYECLYTLLQHVDELGPLDTMEEYSNS